MANRIAARLAELNITLPEARAPAANYVPFVRTGDLVFISGQIPDDGTGLVTGKLGDDASLETGVHAARHCALALIAHLAAACDGDLDRVKKVVKLTGFVNAAPDFKDHPKVVNGASDLMVEVFGPEVGSHARAAIGHSSLPLGVAVEVEGVFQIQ